MKLKTFLEEARVSTAAENIDYVTRSSSKNKSYIYAKAIEKIEKWFSEIYSKKATGLNAHKIGNEKTLLYNAVYVYIYSDDKKKKEEFKKMYEKAIEKIKKRLNKK
jgi:hypothetical protein